ncbi:GumC family protein [Marichromatium bheemlicum]|uniref:Lipopolysaccharide biosynthesis protein n=1 Tax=Marichromatium bheemlicum TaxID=365339 RepID=A0ABX1I9C0_9GAMM|nr:hypothetical protein [Marichromatium bheemlicum]NKN34149.1 hypothetical protein [Marichromatium bheemlicum]
MTRRSSHRVARIHPLLGRRALVFVLASVLCVTLALGIVYGREPVYRATASVLTVKPKAVDAPSASADPEHVMIQRRLLLGEALLEQLAVDLAAVGVVRDVPELRAGLAVVPVPETNLLELRAEGGDPERLALIVNHWARAYERLRAAQVEGRVGLTSSELEQQQTQLERRIETARAELEGFAAAHDIVGIERAESRVLAELEDLNDALGEARSQEVEALARLQALDEAVARGERLIPREQRADIARLQQYVERGRERLDQLYARYTQAYIDLDPALRDLPGEQAALEQSLERALLVARITVRDEARQALEAARARVALLETERERQQHAVQTFTHHFATFEGLREGLERHEARFAENAQRLAEIALRDFAQYPPIQVVEWAYAPTLPLRPDYPRDLLIGLAAAFMAALFLTWLTDYLGERASAPRVSYVGVRLDGEGEDGRLVEPRVRVFDAGVEAASLEAQGPRAAVIDLPRLPRLLEPAEIELLLRDVDAEVRGLCALLLSGVARRELALLEPECFDRALGTVEVPGGGRRELALAPAAWGWLEPLLAGWETGAAVPGLARLDAVLGRAAGASRLRERRGVDAEALWHSYLVYLVRQGVGFGALQRRVGPLPPELRSGLRRFVTAGVSYRGEGIDWVHPVLRD